MIASLPMYERPDNLDAHDRFWALIRNHIGTGPESLSRDGDVWAHWRSPELVFSQTCGMPYRNHLHGQVQLVGTPDYGLCDQPGFYRSYFFVRKGGSDQLLDYTDRTFAYNERGSQSGWAAAQNHMLGMGHSFTKTLETGGHLASAMAVADGRADVCAIDALTFELAKDHDASFQNLKLVAQTEPTPGLPYVTGLAQDIQTLRQGVARAIDELPQQDRQKLKVRGLVQLTAEQYLQIANPPENLPK